MGMGGRINRQGGYQQSPYSGGFGSYQPPMYGGGGYSFSPSKGGGFGGYNSYQQTPTPEPFSQMEPFDVSGKPMQPQGNPQLTKIPISRREFGNKPFTPDLPPSLFRQDLQNTPPQQDPNFVYQPPSWLGDELAASTSTNPLKTGESMAEERRLEREKWSQPGYEGPMHSCPSPKEHIQLANNDWILAGNLKVGDEVATSEKPEKVTRVERIERSPRCEVLFQDSDSIVTSYSHPYFVNNKGFVKVSDLKKGDQVGDLVVKDKKPFSDGPVISLSVEKAETYMLRGGTEENPVPALSHNKTPMQGRVYDPNSPRAMEDWKNRRDSFVWTMPGTEAWQEWDERRQRREQLGASGMQSLNGDRETARRPEQTNIYGGRGYSSGPNKGGIFGGGFGNYQQPSYGGGFGGGAFNQGYGMQGGIGSLLPNYSSYMSPRMPFNPYMR